MIEFTYDRTAARIKAKRDSMTEAEKVGRRMLYNEPPSDWHLSDEEWKRIVRANFCDCLPTPRKKR